MSDGPAPTRPSEVVVPRFPSSVELPPFVLANGSGAPRFGTSVRLSWDDSGLRVRFRCDDEDVWGEYRGRDEPLWEQEAVEVFLAPGKATPTRYFELECNPFGAVFDAIVENPAGDRTGMRVDPGWDCEGLEHECRIGGECVGWSVDLRIPWKALVSGKPPPVWRANFFRIERPRNGPHEWSAWSSPQTDPPDFHRPGRFGFLRFGPAPGA